MRSGHFVPSILSQMSWGYRMFSDGNCSSYAAEFVRQKLVHDNGTMQTTFFNYMKPQFIVLKVFNETSSPACNAVIVLPPKPLSVFPWWILW